MGNRALIGGAVIGAAVISAVVSYLVFSEPAETPVAVVDSTTTTITTTPAEPVYVAPGEVVVGPAVLVPTNVSVNDRQAVIDFDLHQLPPLQGLPSGAAFVPFQGFVEVHPEEAEVVFPSWWTMVVDGTEVPGTVANADARAARFDIPDGLTASRVESAWIDGYQIRIPLDIPFHLSTDAPEIEVAPGITVSLNLISEQTHTTIVTVEVTVDDSENLSGIDIAGRLDGVTSATREAEGGPRWNIVFEGSPRESGYPMSLVGSMWVQVPGRIDVPVERGDG